MLASATPSLYVPGVPKRLLSILVPVAVLAFASATVGADLIDLLACGVETTDDCGSASEPGGDAEGACPSCLMGHGHMQPLLASAPSAKPPVASSGVIGRLTAGQARLAVQDIFHPPIAPSL